MRPDRDPELVPPSAAALSARASSAPVANRAAGSFESARVITASTALGTAGLASRIGWGSSFTMRYSVFAASVPPKGFVPVSISYRTVAAEKRSDRASRGRPRTCSGDM